MRLSHKSKIYKKRNGFSPRFANSVSKKMRDLVRKAELNSPGMEVIIMDSGKEVFAK